MLYKQHANGHNSLSMLPAVALSCVMRVHILCLCAVLTSHPPCMTNIISTNSGIHRLEKAYALIHTLCTVSRFNNPSF